MENKYLENVKKEYDEIEVPAEAKERILLGINKAKKGNGKILSFRIVKYTAVTVAACFSCILILANAGATVARAMEKIPVIGAIAKIVTFRTYEDQTEDFSAHVEVPKVVEENIATQANKSIEEYANELITQYENDLKASEGQGNYDLESSYQVVTQTENYLAIEIDTTLVMASGTQYKKVFNIDKTTGNIVTLKDFFVEGSDYKSIISEDIKKQMKEQMAADKNVTYWIDSEVPEWDFNEITDDTAFYFDENQNLIVLFDEYEVAPGSMGAVTFKVKKSVYEKDLK